MTEKRHYALDFDGDFPDILFMTVRPAARADGGGLAYSGSALVSISVTYSTSGLVSTGVGDRSRVQINHPG